MSVLKSIIFNNKPCADGVLPFARKIFFSDACELTLTALSTLGSVYVHDGNETQSEVEVIKELLASTPQLFEADELVLTAYPIPELIGNDYAVLCQKHTDKEAQISTLSTGQNNVSTVIINTQFLTQIVSTLQIGTVQDIINTALAYEDVKHEQNTIAGLCELCDIVTLYYASKAYRQRMNFHLISMGVHIVDMDNTYVSSDCTIGKGTVILPNSIIIKGTIIGEDAKIGPSSYIENAKIGDRTKINNSQVYQSEIGTDGTVGPFAYIRPDCKLGNNIKIGDFVELKKATLDDGTKVSHLTYIGDAKVGKNVNFGCGTVVVNYDGYNKYLTEIADDAFIGCNTNLVAPVKVGKGAFTAAGSTVTRSVPDGALAVARVRQDNKEKWADNRRARMEKSKK